MFADNSIEAEVWNFIQDLNRLWTVVGRPEALNEFFHERMVAIAPGDRERITGGEACIAAWKRYVDSTTIESWREYDPQIQLYNNNSMAIVTYYFEITCSQAGQSLTSSGRDMFTLVKENGRWWAVADQFSPFPA
ncbi:nuclear transport factor 2 family protein [bacterium]|nr:MAG: nuclear transport factor 2 family protein [bacterium]